MRIRADKVYKRCCVPYVNNNKCDLLGLISNQQGRFSEVVQLPREEGFGSNLAVRKSRIRAVTYRARSRMVTNDGRVGELSFCHFFAKSIAAFFYAGSRYWESVLTYSRFEGVQ